ncbi:MAG: hypothetical protein CLLPBCKN_004100 [Chroococcidiopsis cubana SAG 39.79]|uniref:hypothetical protein n=1 Tax=Chroococcidiopsis cubana TaxID=171392 RepID=UPI002AC5BF37|nr:hypothetical protein [Chroococcidiopsis cubana]MDZ4874704.1 hypothetical protein [Chroococcidiopsis cubana SAG 39.79]
MEDDTIYCIAVASGVAVNTSPATSHVEVPLGWCDSRQSFLEDYRPLLMPQIIVSFVVPFCSSFRYLRLNSSKDWRSWWGNGNVSLISTVASAMRYLDFGYGSALIVDIFDFSHCCRDRILTSPERGLMLSQ